MSDKVVPLNNNNMTNGDKNHPDADKDSHRLDLNKDQLSNGPVMNRGCTDIICCFLFIAFFVGMCGTAAYGFINGDPMLLLTGWDYDGNGCGYNATTKDYGYLYWPAPDISAISSDYYQAFKYSMCVKECPTGVATDPVLCKEPTFFGDNAKFENCQYYPYAYTQNNGSVSYGSPLRYSTQKVLNKYCIPDTEAAKQTAIKEFKDRFYDTYNVDKFTDYVMDLVNCWQVMLICVGAAFIIGMIYLIILRCCVGVIVWFTIFGVLAALGGGGYWVYKTKDNYDTSDNNYKYLTYGAYAIWGIAGAFFLLILCCCGRIRLAVAIMKVTSQFIYNTPTVLLLPIIFLIICCVWIAAWAFTAVYIFSVGDIQPRDSPLSFVTTVKWSNQTRYIFLYHLFGGLWVNAFLIGCSQFIIAAACAIWYFSFTSDTSGKGSLCQGIKWIFRYHFGSIAFGSFIIAVVQFIRIIFEYYRKKIQAANKNNPVVKFMLCCTGYCLSCLERCVKFITKNAYIQVAISSKNFCRSAWNAFLLVVRNALRFGFVHSLGGIFMFLGRLFIICCTALCCYVMLMYWPYFHDRISSPYFPCIIAGIIGYLIGAIFMSIFSFASDTVLQCFFLDEELGDDAKGRPPNNRPPIMNDFITRANGGKRCCCC